MTSIYDTSDILISQNNTTTINENFLDDTNLPNLYKYFILCIIEQRGSHSLCGISKDPKLSTNNDIYFIRRFIELALNSTHLELIDNQKEYLHTFNSLINNNLMIHLTRDCQIIETGNHYVTLTFKIKKDEYEYNISFSSKFKQNSNRIPIGDNKISVAFKKDLIINKNDTEYQKKTDLLLKNKKNNHTIVWRDDKKIYRDNIFHKYIDIKDDIITFIPCSYLIPKDHILEPKLSPDSCTIS